MPIVVNSNVTATTASFNLSRANDALRQSLSRLSSGNRIVNPSDDAGGMAVAYKLQSKLKRTEAVRQNIQNGISFLQVQDGALSTMGKILDRMSELRTLAQDITKNTMDVENYSKEFLELQIQLSQTYREKFNGISLFAVSAAPQVDNPLRPTMNKGTILNEEGVTVTIFSRTIHTNPSGQTADGSVSVGVINLQNLFRLDGGLDNRYASEFRGNEANSNLSASANLGDRINLGNVNDINKTNYAATHTSIFTSGGFLSSILFVSVGQFTKAIERLADARAENGAEQARLGMANELLIQNQTNLEAAYGRIMDAGVALESTRFARQNALVQSSAAMVAQANQLTSIALTILG